MGVSIVLICVEMRFASSPSKRSEDNVLMTSCRREAAEKLLESLLEHPAPSGRNGGGWELEALEASICDGVAKAD